VDIWLNDCRIRVVAQSLNAARRAAAARTAGSVERCERDGLFDDDEDGEGLLWIDRAKLRGLPAIGRGSSGVVTDSCVPGSDEHLEWLDGR
jgi:hypothetical protein